MSLSNLDPISPFGPVLDLFFCSPSVNERTGFLGDRLQRMKIISRHDVSRIVDQLMSHVRLIT